ncbi:hypothetical protein MSPP1_004225 [Malassezia sp. CBS 17886]|nr:hypothetical protein MSPP1_004225 [Malassezia sp. CBS 17886]
MAHVYGRLRAHQIFGADTDVGKTIFSTALALASAAAPAAGAAPVPRSLAPHPDAEYVAYLKPVSTGPAGDADAHHIATYAPHVSTDTLLQFASPVSPHVAARGVAGIPAAAGDAAIAAGVRTWMRAQAAAAGTRGGAAIVETAGGVHSPGPSGTSQAELLRPLRLPTVLVGSSVLGGISTTRAAFESLLVRGYDVDAVVLFPSPHLENDVYLRDWLRSEWRVPVFTLGGPSGGAWGRPPLRAATSAADVTQMREYYTGLVHGPPDGHTYASALDVVRHLRDTHAARLADLASLAPRVRTSCWWPFTQHERVKCDADVTVVDSAHGDFFAAYDPAAARADAEVHNLAPPHAPPPVVRPLLDGSASWWTQALGHAHPRLALAAAQAAGRYGHVLFPVAANAPAVHLAERLLGTGAHSAADAPGRGWASRVFYSDDGSTAMEVALKMALQSAADRYDAQPTQPATQARVQHGRRAGALGGRPPRMLEVLGLKGSYHGDTIGAMDASEPGIYNACVPWYSGRGHWIAPPMLGMRDGRVHVSVADDDDWARWESRPSVRGERTLATYGALQDVYDVPQRLRNDPLAPQYRLWLRAVLERLVLTERRRFGALLLEPLVLGAAGMVFVDPLFQRCLVDVVREREDLFALTDPPLRDARDPGAAREPTAWRGLPVVFDEVFAGLYRLGVSTASQVLGTAPDIASFAKILTGGLVPLSATLASHSIFTTFAQSDEKANALLHGHSYTAHPVGCAVAGETLTLLDELRDGPAWEPHRRAWARAASGVGAAGAGAAGEAGAGGVGGGDGTGGGGIPRGVWSFWDPAFVHALSAHDRVHSVMALGTVLKVELRDDDGGYKSGIADTLLATLRTLPTDSDDAFPLHLRSLGNVLYVMCSLNTPPSVLQDTQATLIRHLA